MYFINVFGFHFRRFDGNDEDCTHLLKENMTTIFASSGSHKKGSSKLTLKNFVDFNWEHSYYHGQLIALHISEDYIAYGFSKRKYSIINIYIIKCLIYFNFMW
jgi:hypothetical protein